MTEVIIDVPAGKKGLIVNSTNLCAQKRRALANLTAHNGAKLEIKPVVVASKCGARDKKASAPSALAEPGQASFRTDSCLAPIGARG